MPLTRAFIDYCLGCCEIQLAFIQSPTKDHAFNNFVGDLKQRAYIIQTAHPAGGDNRYCHRLRQCYGGFDIDTLQHAVATDVGVNNRLDAVGFKALGHIDNVVTG